MNRIEPFQNRLFLFFTPVILVFVLDLLSKSYTVSISEKISFGWINIKLMHNHGIIMGLLSEFPRVIKVTMLTSIGIMMIFLYVLGIWLLPINSKKIFVGLSALTGGALGNLVDRFQNGSVTDFISLKILNQATPYFNLADIFQWIAYILILIGLREDFRYYWPKNEWRNKYFLNIKFQGKISFLVGFITFSCSLTILIFSYGFLYLIGDSKILQTYLLAGLFIVLFLSLVNMLLMLVWSHRIIGPLHAIMRHFDDVLRGEEVTFKLRNNDEFHDIESKVNKISDKIRRLQFFKK